MYNTDLPRRAELPSTGKLLRSTALAALIAGGLLVTTVLPAEYGIDPTGIGRALGLTPMGEIKMSLAAEARAEERVATETAPAQPVAVAPTVRAEAAPVPAPAPAPVAVAALPPAAVAPEPVAGRQDTVTVTLKPGQGAEVKLTMNKDSRVRYEWASAGGPVNFDTHGDPYDAPKNFYHGYGKGNGVDRQAGEITAAFTGAHGWFWRNRSGQPVTITLRTSGQYTEVKQLD